MFIITKIKLYIKRGLIMSRSEFDTHIYKMDEHSNVKVDVITNFVGQTSIILNNVKGTEEKLLKLNDGYFHVPLVIRGSGDHSKICVLKFISYMRKTPDNKYIVLALQNELDKNDYLSVLCNLHEKKYITSDDTFLNPDRSCWKINSKGAPEYSGIWS